MLACALVLLLTVWAFGGVARADDGAVTAPPAEQMTAPATEEQGAPAAPPADTPAPATDEQTLSLIHI